MINHFLRKLEGAIFLASFTCEGVRYYIEINGQKARVYFDAGHYLGKETPVKVKSCGLVGWTDDESQYYYNFVVVLVAPNGETIKIELDPIHLVD